MNNKNNYNDSIYPNISPSVPLYKVEQTKPNPLAFGQPFDSSSMEKEFQKIQTIADQPHGRQERSSFTFGGQPSADLPVVRKPSDDSPYGRQLLADRSGAPSPMADSQEYKLKHIKDVEFELKRNLEIRNSLRKRYKNINNTLDYTNYFLNTISFVSGVSSVSLLTTIALIPVSIILGGVSAGCGVTSIISTKLNKKFKHKEDKHKDISNLCENKLNTINSILSKALKDGVVTEEEFELILKEEKHFRKRKENIRNKKLIVNDNNELKESVINFVKKFK